MYNLIYTRKGNKLKTFPVETDVEVKTVGSMDSCHYVISYDSDIESIHFMLRFADNYFEICPVENCIIDNESLSLNEWVFLPFDKECYLTEFSAVKLIGGKNPDHLMNRIKPKQEDKANSFSDLLAPPPPPDIPVEPRKKQRKPKTRRITGEESSKTDTGSLDPSKVKQILQELDIEDDDDVKTTAELEKVKRAKVDIPEGEITGRYQVLQKVGAGAMGDVYKVYDRQLQRNLALKLLVVSDTQSVEAERFKRETLAIGKLSHPYIVALHDVGVYKKRPFFTMDLLEGRNLQEIVQAEGAITPRKAMQLAQNIAQALEFSHQNGIIHRDIKPSNIIVTEQGAILTDFGIAKDTNVQSMLTTAGETLGTPAYMSPEQAQSIQDKINATSDIYSLGAVLYELLAGHTPFDGPPIEVLNKVCTIDPYPIRKYNKEIHPDAITVTMKAMDKEQCYRYSSAKEMSDDIDRYLDGEPIEGTLPPLHMRTFRMLRYHKKYSIILSACLCLLIVFVGYKIFQNYRDGKKRQQEAQEFLVEARAKHEQAKKGKLSLEEMLKIRENYTKVRIRQPQNKEAIRGKFEITLLIAEQKEKEGNLEFAEALYFTAFFIAEEWQLQNQEDDTFSQNDLQAATKGRKRVEFLRQKREKTQLAKAETILEQLLEGKIDQQDITDTALSLLRFPIVFRKLRRKYEDHENIYIRRAIKQARKFYRQKNTKKIDTSKKYDQEELMVQLLPHSGSLLNQYLMSGLQESKSANLRLFCAKMLGITKHKPAIPKLFDLLIDEVKSSKQTFEMDESKKNIRPYLRSIISMEGGEEEILSRISITPPEKQEHLFTIHDKFEIDLEDGFSKSAKETMFQDFTETISYDLRQEFKKHKVFFSQKVKIGKRQTEIGIIENGDDNYVILQEGQILNVYKKARTTTLQTPSLYKKKFLFTIPQKHLEGLRNNDLGDEVLQLFEKHRIPLAEDAEIAWHIFKEWSLEDKINKKLYWLIKSQEQFLVYDQKLFQNYETRKKCVWSLIFGNKSTISLATKIFADYSDNLSQYQKNPENFPILYNYFANTEADYIVQIFQQVGKPSIHHLDNLLRNGNSIQQLLIMEILSGINDWQVVSLITEMAQSKEKLVKHTAFSMMPDTIQKFGLININSLAIREDKLNAYSEISSIMRRELRNNDIELQIYAVRTLAKFGRDEDLDRYIRTLEKSSRKLINANEKQKDQIVKLQFELVESIGSLGNKISSKLWREILNSKGDKKILLLTALAKIEPKKAVRELIPYLIGNDETKAKIAVKALQNIDEEVLVELTRLYDQSPKATTRCNILLATENIESDEIIAIYEKALEDKREEVALTAIHVLAQKKGKKTLQLLLKALMSYEQDDHAIVRETIKILGMRKDLAEKMMVVFLNADKFSINLPIKSEKKLRRRSAEILVKMGRSALAHIKKIIHGDFDQLSPETKGYVLEILGEVGTYKEVPFLIQYLFSHQLGDHMEKILSHRLSNRMKRMLIPEIIKIWTSKENLEYPEKIRLLNVINNIGTKSPPASQDKLLEILSAQLAEKQYRKVAASAMKNIGTPSIKYLVAALENSDRAEGAVMALSTMPPKIVLYHLQTILQDPEVEVEVRKQIPPILVKMKRHNHVLPTFQKMIFDDTHKILHPVIWTAMGDMGKSAPPYILKWIDKKGIGIPPPAVKVLLQENNLRTTLLETIKLWKRAVINKSREGVYLELIRAVTRKDKNLERLWIDKLVGYLSRSNKAELRTKSANLLQNANWDLLSNARKKRTLNIALRYQKDSEIGGQASAIANKLKSIIK